MYRGERDYIKQRLFYMDLEHCFNMKLTNMNSFRDEYVNHEQCSMNIIKFKSH